MHKLNKVFFVKYFFCVGIQYLFFVNLAEFIFILTLITFIFFI